MVIDEQRQSYLCEWCGKQFPRRVRWGRRPQYCGRVCRQRAYEERRRGAFRLGLPVPTAFALPRHPPRYERGAALYPSRKQHALRPDGAADAVGRRPTMCGARVRPAPSPFHPIDPRNCISCTRIVRRFPPWRFFNGGRDAGTLGALVAILRDAANANDDELRAAVGQLLAHSGAPAGSFGPAA